MVEYHPDFSLICSIGKAPFYGTIIISYQPQHLLLEFGSFEDWLRDITNNKMTIEAFTRLIFDTLIELLGDVSLKVTVKAQTIVHAPVIVTIKQKE